MRRSSYTPVPPEPLIVVEEAEGSDEDTAQEAEEAAAAAAAAAAEDSKMDVAGALQQASFSIDEEDEEDTALLCPWRDPRDLRKRSLPTPACTSGITASQVRRLSERSAATARESAFLATLTTAPAPGRRHSVTISRVPPTIYPGCRGRRESIAAFPSGRRDSAAASFNLHLDIMDDIAEIKGARKAKMKMYKTSSKEQVCEISMEGDMGSPVRFHSPAISPLMGGGTLRAPADQGRRHSDSAGLASLVQPAMPMRRKASEQLTTGIVCTDHDLVKLLSLSTQDIKIPPPAQFKSEAGPSAAPDNAPESKKSALNSRSNSFDIAMLPALPSPPQVKPSFWFGKRQQSGSKDEGDSSTESSEQEKPQPPEVPPRVNVGQCAAVHPAKVESKVVWDKPTGSVVDAQLLGSAIEVYLRRGDSASPLVSPSAAPTPVPPPSPIPTQQQEQQPQPPPPPPQPSADEAGNSTDAPRDSSSICSTFKDLFVK